MNILRISRQHGLREVVLDALRELRIEENSVACTVPDNVIEDEAMGRFGDATGGRRDRAYPQPIGDDVADVAEDGILVRHGPGGATGCVVVDPHSMAWNSGHIPCCRRVAINFIE